MAKLAKNDFKRNKVSEFYFKVLLIKMFASALYTASEILKTKSS